MEEAFVTLRGFQRDPQSLKKNREEKLTTNDNQLQVLTKKEVKTEIESHSFMVF